MYACQMFRLLNVFRGVLVTEICSVKCWELVHPTGGGVHAWLVRLHSWCLSYLMLTIILCAPEHSLQEGQQRALNSLKLELQVYELPCGHLEPNTPSLDEQ